MVSLDSHMDQSEKLNTLARQFGRINDDYLRQNMGALTGRHSASLDKSAIRSNLNSLLHHKRDQLNLLHASNQYAVRLKADEKDDFTDAMRDVGCWWTVHQQRGRAERVVFA